MKNYLYSVSLTLAAFLFLSACESTRVSVSRNETTLITVPGEGPPDAIEGACYGKDVTPAVIEVVTEQKLVEPAKIASDGAIIKPPVYETSTRQEIVDPRKEFFFEVPCAEQFTPAFITSLQRALKARRLYKGRLSGKLDRKTLHAIRTFQMPNGLNSDILTMDSARQLGLVAYGRGNI